MRSLGSAPRHSGSLRFSADRLEREAHTAQATQPTHTLSHTRSRGATRKLQLTTVPYSTHTTVQFRGCMNMMRRHNISRRPAARGPARTDEPPRHDTGRGHDDASSTHTASPLLAYLRGPRCPLALLPALVPLALAARGGGSRYLICHCPPSAISRSKIQWSSTEYGSSAVPRPPTCGGGGAWERSDEGQGLASATP